MELRKGVMQTMSVALNWLRADAGVFEAGCFPGSWWHLQLFFTSLEVGFAYAAVASSTALSNVRPHPPHLHPHLPANCTSSLHALNSAHLLGSGDPLKFHNGGWSSS